MLAGRLRPESAETAFVVERALTGAPIALTAASVLEVFYGLRRRAEQGDPRFANQAHWLRRLLQTPEVPVLPLNARAAQVAGAVRALRRTPPARGRGRGRSKAEERVAWMLDVETAATAWVHGHDVVTADRGHYEAIAEAIATLAPDGPRLGVVSPPVFSPES